MTAGYGAKSAKTPSCMKNEPGCHENTHFLRGEVFTHGWCRNLQKPAITYEPLKTQGQFCATSSAGICRRLAFIHSNIDEYEINIH
ncbi:MAG: hypothetical protein AB9836_01135 [Aminipila sp.]